MDWHATHIADHIIKIDKFSDTICYKVYIALENYAWFNWKPPPVARDIGSWCHSRKITDWHAGGSDWVVFYKREDALLFFLSHKL